MFILVVDLDGDLFPNLDGDRTETNLAKGPQIQSAVCTKILQKPKGPPIISMTGIYRLQPHHTVLFSLVLA